MSLKREQQREFIKQVETVSAALAAWAQNCFDHDWSLDDVKRSIREAAKICGKEI